MIRIHEGSQPQWQPDHHARRAQQLLDEVTSEIDLMRAAGATDDQICVALGLGNEWRDRVMPAEQSMWHIPLRTDSEPLADVSDGVGAAWLTYHLDCVLKSASALGASSEDTSRLQDIMLDGLRATVPNSAAVQQVAADLGAVRQDN